MNAVSGLGTKLFSIVCLILFLGFIGFYVIPVFSGKIALLSGFQIGPAFFRYYSLAILSGAVAAYAVARRYAYEFSVRINDLENLIVINVFAGLIGARIHHVLSMWDFYAQRPELVWQFWRGGLGFFGGLIAGLAATAIYCRMKKIVFLSAADLLALVLPLAQSLGRWGNFFNQEAFGYPTQLPWKMFIEWTHRPAGYLTFDYYHPVFLYESLLNLMIFFLLWTMIRKKTLRLPGDFFACYLIFYGIVRWLIEPLRLDASLFYGIYLNQLLALVLAVLGLGIMCRRLLYGTSRKSD